MGTPVPEGTPHPAVLQVLGSVKNKIESFAASQEDFPALLFKAKKYLIARGRLDWAEGPGAVPALRRTDTLGEDMASAGGLGSVWGAAHCVL